MGHLFVLLTWLQQLFHLYLGSLANFVSYTFKILVSQWRETDSYELRIMSWPLISGFRYLFFDVFCVPGVGTLNLIWRFFDARPMGVLQKFRVTDTNPHPCPHLPGFLHWYVHYARDHINAKNHWASFCKVLPKKCIFKFIMQPWDANLKTYSHRSSFMGPFQMFWWLHTSEIIKSKDSKRKKYIA